jgi:hypothetical protein
MEETVGILIVLLTQEYHPFEYQQIDSNVVWFVLIPTISWQSPKLR